MGAPTTTCGGVQKGRVPPKLVYLCWFPGDVAVRRGWVETTEIYPGLGLGGGKPELKVWARRVPSGGLEREAIIQGPSLSAFGHFW